MEENMVESIFFLVTGTMFFPPLVVMRVKALLSSYGFWSWLLVFFLALGFDGHSCIRFAFVLWGCCFWQTFLSGVGKN